MIVEEPAVSCHARPCGLGELLQGSHTQALQISRVVFTRKPSSLSSEAMTQPHGSVFLHFSVGPTVAGGSCLGARVEYVEHVYSRISTKRCFTFRASCQTVKSTAKFLVTRDIFEFWPSYGVYGRPKRNSRSD